MMEDYPESNSGADEPGERPADQGQESDEGNTALLPKTLFGGKCKVGDRYTVEVVGVLEDELEVKPVKGGDKHSSEDDSKSRMQMAGDQLDSMDQG